MRKYLITCPALICFLLVINLMYAFGQGGSREFLTRLKKAKQQASYKTNTGNVVLLNTLAEKYFYNSPDSALLFAKDALALAKIQHFEKGIAAAHINIARAYYILGSYFPSLTASDEAMAISQRIGYPAGIGASYNNKGLIYLAQDRMQDAIYEFDKSLSYAVQLKDSIRIASNYFNIGLCYDEIKQFNKAFYNLKKGRGVAEKAKAWHVNQMIINRMGETYYHAKNYSLALKYYTLALNFKHYQDNWERGFAYSGIGQTYYAMGRYTDAVKNTEKGLALSLNLKAGWDVQRAYNILAKSYAATHDYKNAYTNQVLSKKYADSLFTAAKETLKNNFIQIKLQGEGQNRFGVGSTIKVFAKGEALVYYQQPTRGFQSSTSPNLITIGVGKESKVDSIQLIWPGGKYQVAKNLQTNKVYTYKFADAKLAYDFTKKTVKPMFTDVAKTLFDSVPTHIENGFIDFDNERLMLQMLSIDNPYMAKGDLNKDGLEDFYFGSSKDSPASIYIQQKSGRFHLYVPEDLGKQSYLENAGAAFGDFDGDGDEDIIIGVGGNEDEAETPVYFPRFYENDGKGNLHRNAQKSLPAPVNASVVMACDYDKDGYPDLFIGGRSMPGTYGVSPRSYVFHNNGDGRFTDVSAQILGADTKLGMVTSAQWADMDGNGSPDLVVAGNWMGIRIFKNDKGKFTEDKQLDKYKGWWSSLQIADVNGDGKQDIIAGNIGLNIKFRASFEEPMKIYIKDFDKNGTKECVTSMYKTDHIPYVFHMKPDLVGQMPILKKKYLKYDDYAGKPFSEIFPDDQLEGAEMHEMNYLASAVFINEGGKFTVQALPYNAQLSSVNTILCDDLDNGGVPSIILGGNFYGFKPEVGRLDASHGQIYKYTKSGFVYISPAQSGLNLTGQIRSSLMIKNSRGEKYFLFGLNDDKLKAYKLH